MTFQLVFASNLPLISFNSLCHIFHDVHSLLLPHSYFSVRISCTSWFRDISCSMLQERRDSCPTIFTRFSKHVYLTSSNHSRIGKRTFSFVYSVLIFFFSSRQSRLILSLPIHGFLSGTKRMLCVSLMQKLPQLRFS